MFRGYILWYLYNIYIYVKGMWKPASHIRVYKPAPKAENITMNSPEGTKAVIFPDNFIRCYHNCLAGTISTKISVRKEIFPHRTLVNWRGHFSTCVAHDTRSRTRNYVQGRTYFASLHVDTTLCLAAKIQTTSMKCTHLKQYESNLPDFKS